MDALTLHRLLMASDKGYHIDTIYKARRAGHTSRRLALDAEEVTGIAREKWVFPEKFGTPWDEE